MSDPGAGERSKAGASPGDGSTGEREGGDPQRSAFALRYDPSRDAAPRLIARGRGILADRILSLAEGSSVPVVQDPDLAGVLAGVGLDCEIPPRLFAAVAGVLVHVAALEGRAKKERW
jgi:flagellar biosynthesis protein